MSDELPPNDFVAPPPPPIPLGQTAGQPGDTFVSGCAMGCGMTIGAIVVCLGLAFLLDGKKGDYVVMSWGVVQLIGNIPLILSQRSKGYKNRVTGLIVAACIALLVGMACASMLSNLSFR